MQPHSLWAIGGHVTRLIWSAGLVLALAGCFAQQADLVKQEKELSAKIAKARTDLDQLIGETRARLNQEITTLRDEELPAIRGSMDKSTNRFDVVQRRLDDAESKTAARLGVIEQLQLDQANLLKAERDRTQEELAKLAETVSALAKTVEAKLAAHEKAIATLVDFKAALTKLGDRLVQEEQRLAELSAKVDANAKITSDHLAAVNKSIGSITKALQAVGETVQAREAGKTLKGRAGQEGTAKGGKQSKDGKRIQKSAYSPEAEPSEESVPGTAGPSASGAIASADGSVAAEIEQKDYERSLQAFLDGEYEQARKDFTEFLRRYPDSTLAPNAQYWLGESYYGTKDYARAIEAFDQVNSSYPNSPKVPAALLKKGYAYLALNDRGRASSTLKQVIETYPKSPEADKALEKLAQLQ